MSKKRKEKGLISGVEMHSALSRLTSRISSIGTKSEFDKTKVELIKLFSKIKQNPFLQEFDAQRIELLKECNINIQFLNRDEDVWNLISRGNLEDAYEEIIATTKAISDHPDRHHIKSWVSSQIRDSLRKIADLATSIPKKKESNDHTIMPQQFSDDTTPISPSTAEKTLMPKAGEPLNPFAQSDFTSSHAQPNPFDQNIPRTAATIKPSHDFETIFQKADVVSPFEETFRPNNLTPTNSNSKTFIPKATKKADDNSIKTFWVREDDQELIQGDNQGSTNSPFKEDFQDQESDPFKPTTKKIKPSDLNQ